MTSLADLFSILAPIHALAVDGRSIRVLCSDPTDSSVPDRRAVVVDLAWPLTAAFRFELPGAHRFLLPNGYEEIGDQPVPVALTAGGTVSMLSRNGGYSSLEIAAPEVGPLFLGHLTCLLLGEDVLVGGMSRQLYRASRAARVWNRADEGLLDVSSSEPNSAIYGMTRTSTGDLVLVGGDGQVWRGRPGHWVVRDSGTNVMLNSVCHLPGKGCIACGAGGALIHIRDDSSYLDVEHRIESHYLSQVAMFKGSCFVVALDGVHRFDTEPRLKYAGLVEGSRGAAIAAIGPDSFWVLGLQSIGRSVDGISWVWADASAFALSLPPE